MMIWPFFLLNKKDRLGDMYICCSQCDRLVSLFIIHSMFSSHIRAPLVATGILNRIKWERVDMKVGAGHQPFGVYAKPLGQSPFAYTDTAIMICRRHRSALF